jgi:hypothetical protein
LATSPTRIGVKPAPARTTAAAMSAVPFTKPVPRITYSTRFSSVVRAPMSRFEFCTAAKISSSDTPAARAASGSTSTWYSRTKPPMAATSEMPCAARRP